MDELSPAELGGVVQDVLLVRYATVSTLALLVYDFALTFDEEKRMVWPTRLSLPKVLFLLNRYLPFIGVSGLVYVVVLDSSNMSRRCRTGFIASSFIVFGGYVIAELILFVRAYAVYGCTRAMLGLIGLTLSAVYGTGIYYTFRFLVSATVVELPLFPSGCLLTFTDPIEWIAFVVLICSETVAVTLLIFKAYHLSRSTIMRTIIRDGVAYYVFILCASIANLIVLRVTSPVLCNMLLSIQAALHSIFCTRLLLSIRSTYAALESDMEMTGWRRPRSTPVLDSEFTISIHDVTSRQ